MVTGRFLGIKKSTILKVLGILAFLAFVGYVFLSIFWIKNPQLWFFGFCLFLGGFEILKSFLFKYDSSLFLGCLLIFLGIFGYTFFYTNTAAYAVFFVGLAFLCACVSTYIFSGQWFHLIIAYSIGFVEIFAYLYVKKLITMPIFIAFVLPFLLLLVVNLIVYFCKRFSCKKNGKTQ